MTSPTSKFRFTALVGFFEQDTPAGLQETTTLPGLGLISRPYETDAAASISRTDWERFVHYLSQLNNSGDDNLKYRLLFAARHGEGSHNVMEAKVGTAEWERYWARLDGDGETVWADAHLTEKGAEQANAMKAFWEASMASSGLPLPRRHYSSPLTRCLQTCERAFTGLRPTNGVTPPFKPTIKEMIRERLGIHTCDRRSTRTEIERQHPIFSFEEGFSNDDMLWVPDVRETLEEHALRIEAFLEDLFSTDDEHIISITAHSGSILALYKAIGHAEVRVAPGAIVPVFIKAERV